MSNKEIGLWFDKAYASLVAGDFASATNAFEYIIANFDAYAAGIAQQRLRWYCVPLKTVFGKIQESERPTNVHKVLAEIFQVDHHSLDTSLQRVFEEIERGLSSLSSCIRVGEEYWISKRFFDEMIQFAANHIQADSGLVLLTNIIKEKWSRTDVGRANLPDYVTQKMFAERLVEYQFHILAHGQCFISQRGVSTAIESFRDLLQKNQKPVRLRDFLADHFSTDTYLNELDVFFKGHLDARFIELSPGFEFLVDFIRLDAISLDRYFQGYLQPLSTTVLLDQVFFADADQSSKLSPKFLKLATQQLSRNTDLCRLPYDQWILAQQLEQLLAQIIDYLNRQEKPLTTKETLKSLQTSSLGNEGSFLLLIDPIESKLRQSQLLINTGNSRWLHREAFQRACDRAYSYLLDSKEPQTTGLLLQHVFKLNKDYFSTSFITIFEKLLSVDERFSSQNINRQTYWQCIDPSYRYHEQFYQILLQRHRPLAFSQLLSLISEGSEINLSKVDLSQDKRFAVFPGDRWGLSHWAWLNDLAFEYVAKTHQYYHANVIVGLICQQNKIPEKNAIFLPGEDSRFVKDSINRWGIIYRLKDSEIDRIYAELVKRMGLGCSLEDVLRYVTQLPVDMTDVAELLSRDSRFICLDGKWFARETAFYELKETDLNSIYEFISSLSLDQLPISIGDLVQKMLGRDVRLTNAEEQLQSDNRFKEVFERFWAFADFELPDIGRERLSLGRTHVRSDRTPSGGEEIHLPVELTPRKSIQRGERSSVTTPAKKAYITLTHLDVLHGNLRISGILKQMIPDDPHATHFQDDQNHEFPCQVDETRSVLHIRPWLEKRGLTFGDKISIQPGEKPNTLFIRSYGERDQRVYQEAIQHQDVERLIEEARRVGKSYHDLIIEVMEALSIPLHREDIFQLVDYERTATRNTIFEILSLVECPYEELRYFVPSGRGYWSFDRERKEAYDMKMQELLQQNSALKGNIALLTDQLESQNDLIEQFQAKQTSDQSSSLKERISQIEHERDEIARAHEKLTVETTDQRTRLEQLSSQLELLQSHNAKSKENVVKLEAENKEFALTVDQLTLENSNLRHSLEQIQQAEVGLRMHIEELQLVLSQCQNENTGLREPTNSSISKANDVQSRLQAIEEENLKQLNDLHTRLKAAEAALGDAESELKQTRVQAARNTISVDVQHQLDDYRDRFDQISGALNTPLGRLFSWILRIS